MEGGTTSGCRLEDLIAVLQSFPSLGVSLLPCFRSSLSLFQVSSRRCSLLLGESQSSSPLFRGKDAFVCLFFNVLLNSSESLNASLFLGVWDVLGIHVRALGRHVPGSPRRWGSSALILIPRTSLNA